MDYAGPDKHAQHQYGKTQVRLDFEEVRKLTKPGTTEGSRASEPTTTQGPPGEFNLLIPC
jgi:hypothetical protein